MVLKFFKCGRYCSNNVVHICQGDPGVVLEAVNNLHPNLYFTIEELDSNCILAFLNSTVNVVSGKMSHVGGTKNPLIPAPT